VVNTSVVLALQKALLISTLASSARVMKFSALVYVENWKRL